MFVVDSCLVLIQWFTQQKLPSMPISKPSDKNAKDTQVFGLWPGFREVGIPAQTETHTHNHFLFTPLHLNELQSLYLPTKVTRFMYVVVFICMVHVGVFECVCVRIRMSRSGFS